MLAIRHKIFDRVKNVKAITAGAVAFGVGMTGAAAYVGSGLVYDNFSYEFADPKASAKVAGASTTSEVKAENGETGMPANSGSTWSSSPVTSQNGGSARVSVPSTSGSTTTPQVGGMGAGAAVPSTPTVTVPPAPTTPTTVVPTTPETCPCSLLNNAESTVDVVVDGLGL